MPKITPYSGKDVVKVGRAQAPDPKVANAKWWLLSKPQELAASLFGVVVYLKREQGWRQHQAALFARLYGNLPIWNYIGINLTKLNAQYRFPSERPTLNVIQSCADSLISRMVQSKPKPMWLTEGGNYRKRLLAKDMNKFTDGEFYQVKAYDRLEEMLRDSLILGDGFLKVIRTDDDKAGVERTMCTELFVDDSDGMYGFPQQLHQLKIMDRSVAAALWPDQKSAIMNAQEAYFDSSTQSRDSISDQIMVVESWHLRSGVKAKDGRHVIAIDNAILVDDKEWNKDRFPFVKFPYAPRSLGYWAQGLAEQLMGIQNNINQILSTIQQILHLCGSPKWLVEDGSKIVSAQINNMIGGQIKYQGIKPELTTFPIVPNEMVQQLDRLVTYAYQQSGISMLAAASQKPAGLDSGAALREYDDLQSDRFAYLSQRYERAATDLAYLLFDTARDIANDTGKYETIYPGKGSIIKMDLPKMDPEKDPFIIQTFPVSALSKNPAERKQQVIDLMQSGLYDPSEGRRLLDFPDTQQVDDLLNAPEERILKILDAIIEDGEFEPPDPQMDLQKAESLTIQYWNKYLQENLEIEKQELLTNFLTQIRTLKQSAMAAAAPPPQAPAQPMANPMPTPQSPMIPNVATNQ